MAVPVFFTLIAEPLYILVDTAIVGRISTAALGGLSLAGSVLVSVTWIFGFLATGVTTQVGQRLGSGDRDGAASAVAQGAWVALALSTIATLTIALGGPAILRLIGGEADVLRNATTYLRISALGIPAVLFSFLAIGWLRGSSNMRTPLVVAVVANVINVIVEVVLVYVFDFGIAGSAWGTVLVQWLSGLWLGATVLRDVRPQKLQPKALRGLLTIGGAMLLRTSSMIGTITLAASVASRSSKSVLGGHQIAVQAYTFLAFAIDALAVSSQTVFAEETGRGDVTTLRPLMKRLVRLGALFGSALGVGLAVVSAFVPRLFTPDAAVQRNAFYALLLVALMQLTGAVVFVLDGVLMGANRFGQLAGAAVGAALAFLVVITISRALPGPRIVQIWIGMNVWMLVRMLGNLAVANSMFGRRSREH